jgi:hypothetical protein
MGGRLLNGEVVHETGINEGAEGNAAQREVYLHRLAGANSGDRVLGDLGVVNRGIVQLGCPIVIAWCLVEEADALADAVVAPPKFLVAVEAEAQAAALLHLLL